MQGQVPGPNDPPLWQTKASSATDAANAVVNPSPSLETTLNKGTYTSVASEPSSICLDAPSLAESSKEDSSLYESSREELTRGRHQAGSPQEGFREGRLRKVLRMPLNAAGVFVEGISGELGALKEGYSYMMSPGNRYAALASMKPSLAMHQS